MLDITVLPPGNHCSPLHPQIHAKKYSTPIILGSLLLVNESTISVEAVTHTANFECVGQIAGLDYISIVLFAVQVEKYIPFHSLFKKSMFHFWMNWPVSLLHVANLPTTLPPFVKCDPLPSIIQIAKGFSELVAWLSFFYKALIHLILLKQYYLFFSAIALNLQILNIKSHFLGSFLGRLELPLYKWVKK